MIRLFLLLTLCIAAKAATTFPVDNAAFLYGQSPENWRNSGSSYSLAINEGAYFRLVFTGTSFAINVDVSALVGAGYGAAYYPTIKYNIDGGSFTRRQLLSSDTSISLATGLSDTSHTVLVYLDGMDESTNSARWDGTSGLKITGLVVDTGKSLSIAARPGANMIVFSDSIGSGSVALGAVVSGNYSIVQSASVGWPQLIASQYNMGLTNVSFCGQGFEAGIEGVPAVTSSYNLIMSGVSRPFTTSYAICIVQFGTNGGLSSGSILSTFLTNLRTALGSSTKMYVIIPLNQNAAATIASGYSTYMSANPGDNCVKVDLGSYGAGLVTSNSYDGVHPNQAGYALIASAYMQYIPPASGGASSSSMAAGTITIND